MLDHACNTRLGACLQLDTCLISPMQAIDALAVTITILAPIAAGMPQPPAEETSYGDPNSGDLKNDPVGFRSSSSSSPVRGPPSWCCIPALPSPASSPIPTLPACPACTQAHAVLLEHSGQILARVRAEGGRGLAASQRSRSAVLLPLSVAQSRSRGAERGAELRFLVCTPHFHIISCLVLRALSSL